MVYRSSVRAGGRFETYSWLFMRASGVILLVMAVFHLLLMHYGIGVENLSFQLVAERWASPWWRLYDLFLLFFALLHGTNGARIVVDDYVPRGVWRTLTQALLLLTFFALLVMGTYIIITFEAAAR